MGTNERAMPLSKIRRIIGERMCMSLARTAQFTLTREIEVDTLLAYIQQQKEAGGSIKFMHVLIKVISNMLKDHMLLNASIVENKLVYHDTVNMGVAVALPEGDGLLVPVLKNTETCSLLEIAEAYGTLIPKAQKGKLSYNDMSGGTFTISNLGMVGIDAFTPVVNYPEAAILGIGRINDRVVLSDHNVPERRKTIMFSLTVDHRIVDGYVGAQFLASLADTLSDMEKLYERLLK